jgi:hypothetical protein
MDIKRAILEETVRQDPEPETYEEWLMTCCAAQGGPIGPVRAMALDVLSDWRLAQTSGTFRAWLDQGAPSDDTKS